MITPGIHPHAGSELGIGYQWCRSLARHFEVHLVTGSRTLERLRGDSLLDRLVLHPTPMESPDGLGWRFYAGYHAWCRHLPAVLRDLAATVRPVGLHHLNLGSFRMLPRYDRVGLPYTLGPIGGGEHAPGTVLDAAELPFAVRLTERWRDPINRAFVAMPALRSVVGNCRRALATSAETAAILQSMGARDIRVVWPVALADRDAARTAAAERPRQASTLTGPLRCVFGGRNVWWKGGTVAARLVLRMRAAGIPAELDVFSDGAVVTRMKSMFGAAGQAQALRVHGFSHYDTMLEALTRAHVFVLPSFHDSSGYALPEAFQCGLPAFTLGLGGHRTSACADAGVHDVTAGLDSWYAQCVDAARAWRADPAVWLACSRAARRHYELHLGEAALDETVTRSLEDVYGGAGFAVLHRQLSPERAEENHR